jgi:uncharacterized protein YegP (UPF0339 family)
MDDVTTRKGARYIFVSSIETGRVRPAEVRRSQCDFGWRLVAANNRAVARSEQLFTTLDDCIAAARVVRARSADLRGVCALDRDAERWHWVGRVGEATVARCVRTYARRVECARALAQFRLLAAFAEPNEAEVQHLGARVTRGYQPSPGTRWSAVATPAPAGLRPGS